MSKREKIIAHALTNEVMDENYRGTRLIKKHGLRLDTKAQTMWTKLIRLTGTIIRKYVYYAGKD